MSRSSICLGWFALHFFVIIAVSCRDTFLVLGGGNTYLPGWLDKYWQRAQAITSTALGGELPASHPVRQSISGYAYATGIEAGYGYFAPTIPRSCKLIFEFYYPDGRVEYDLPSVRSNAAGYRLATLLDNIQPIRYEPLRVTLLKALTYSAWQEHPDASRVRALFGFVTRPSLAEFRAGSRDSFKLLYSYDFGLLPPSSPSKGP